MFGHTKKKPESAATPEGMLLEMFKANVDAQTRYDVYIDALRKLHPEVEADPGIVAYRDRSKKFLAEHGAELDKVLDGKSNKI